jgi:GDPmannose 4,6-dehydratase
MWLMLQQEKPNDFVVATGIGATIRDFCEQSFSRVNLNWEKYVEIDKRYLRPTEVDALVGDNSKMRAQLGWSPKTDWKNLANLMVDADIGGTK